MVGSMTTPDSTVPVVVDRVHTGPEARWDHSARLAAGGGSVGGVGWLSSARRT